MRCSARPGKACDSARIAQGHCDTIRIARGRFQIGHLRYTDEAFDFDCDPLAVPLCGEEMLGAEIQIHLPQAERYGERIVRECPPVFEESVSNRLVVELALRHRALPTFAYTSCLTRWHLPSTAGCARALRPWLIAREVVAADCPGAGRYSDPGMREPDDLDKIPVILIGCVGMVFGCFGVRS
jgi:hypothetical protein